MADEKAKNSTSGTNDGKEFKVTSSKTQTNLGNGEVADRESDRMPDPTDVAKARADGTFDSNRGEHLAEEAVEKRSATGGNVEIVEKDGVRSAVAHPFEDHSDNKKVYKDVRVNPRDTNAPDAGMTQMAVESLNNDLGH